MVILPLSRRAVLAGGAALACSPRATFANGVIELSWSDLVPVGETPIPPSVQGLFGHDENDTLISEQPRSSGVRTDWNGQTVRLPGFIVPLDFSGVGVTAFILVPYVGACIHVPPPPANQLVFVTTDLPYDSAGLYEAVTVEGRLTTTSTSTELADISYAVSADSVERYRS